MLGIGANGFKESISVVKMEGNMGKDKKDHSSVYQTLALVSQFGISMLVPIFLCSFLGKFIDDRLNTSYWFIILFFVGALAGFRNIYILARKTYEPKEKSDDFESVRKALQQERENNQKKGGES